MLPEEDCEGTATEVLVLLLDDVVGAEIPLPPAVTLERL